MRITYPTIRVARYSPDRIAALDHSRTLSYQQLESAIVRDAQRLLALGVKRGDRVAIAAENAIVWVSLIHGLARVGAILAPINIRWSKSEAARVIDVLRPCVLIADEVSAEWLFGDDRSDTMTAISLGSRRPGWQPWEEVESPDRPVSRSVELDDVCTILATSGSSGTAKSVALTYGNHFFSALASAINLGHRTTDRWLVNLPLFHVGGLSIIHRAAVSGFSTYIQSGSDTGETLTAINSHEITHLSLVSTTLQRLMDSHGVRKCPPHLRAVLVGGGATDRALLQDAHRVGLPVLPTYGMTETASQVATMSRISRDELFDGGVRPLPLCDVEVRDEHRRPAGVDVAGRICVRGPMVARGYWLSDERIQTLSEESWFVSEDIGTMDTWGRLRVIGRRDDVIISGGENVSLAEIEETLNRLPEVRRAAVVAASDTEWGQSTVAFIETESELSEASVRAQLRESLAAYKIPRQVVILEQLPETAIGKIDRQALTAQLNER